MISQISVALHNIRSTHNVGSIFRTADGAGVEKLYLCGVTPSPVDRFGRARADVAKVALGAEKTVPWESVADSKDLIERLKKEGYKVFALEQSEKSVDYRTAKLGGRNLLIVGNEVGGIEPEILDICDEILEIPMKGEKESLNVSVAAGIALFGMY